MFYHLEILKKTGPFYPLWLADTYPRRFLRIPENKIWSYNIAEICDNLIEVIKAETMNPGKRFSLRLSARLTYGVIKLFERQRQLLSHSVFSLNMAITKRRTIEVEKPKRKPKKSSSDEQPVQPVAPRAQPAPLVEEELIPEADVIRMLNSSQQVQNNEITLRENPLLTTENKMDNFGEEGDPVSMFLQENVLRDARVEESILGQGQINQQSYQIVVTAEVHRPDETTLPGDSNVASMKDVSHLEKTLHPEDEIVIEASKTIELSKMDETTISNIMHPEVVPEIQVTSIVPDLQPIPPQTIVQETRGTKRPYNSINLDETPELDPNVTLPMPKKRRRIIKDASISLDFNYMMARIQNPHVDLRCQHPLLDAINLEAVTSDFRFNLPYSVFSKRSLICRMNRLSEELRRAYIRNLVTRSVPNDKLAFKRPRPIEDIRANTINESSRNITLNIPMSHLEEQHTTILLPNENNMSIIAPSPTHRSMLSAQDKSLMPEISIPDIADISKDITMDKSIIRSQRQKDKPVSILTTTMDDIRQDISKSVSFNVSDKRKRNTSKKTDTTKESVLEQQQATIKDTEIMASTNQNFIAEVQQFQLDISKQVVPIEEEVAIAREEISLQKSKNNDTSMLGSLDRTCVSLGDESMTAEEKIIKEYLEKEWGNMGVWEKIVSAKKARCYPINVEIIVQRAEIPSIVSKRRVAVNAFKAILFMRKYRFIKVEKHPGAITIMNIRRGDALKDLQNE